MNSWTNEFSNIKSGTLFKTEILRYLHVSQQQTSRLGTLIGGLMILMKIDRLVLYSKDKL